MSLEPQNTVKALREPMPDAAVVFPHGILPTDSFRRLALPFPNRFLVVDLCFLLGSFTPSYFPNLSVLPDSPADLFFLLAGGRLT